MRLNSSNRVADSKKILWGLEWLLPIFTYLIDQNVKCVSVANAKW